MGQTSVEHQCLLSHHQQFHQLLYLLIPLEELQDCPQQDMLVKSHVINKIINLKNKLQKCGSGKVPRKYQISKEIQI